MQASSTYNVGWYFLSHQYCINIDARGSNFCHVAGGQSNFIRIANNSATVHCTPTRRSHDDSADITSTYTEDDSDGQFRHKQRKISSDDPTSSQNIATSSASEVADGLVVKIAQLLIDRGETGDYYRRLEPELESLRQALTLTNLALQTFRPTPLGQNLWLIVVPEMEKVCIVLKELHDTVERYRQGFWPTSIHSLWCQVLRRGCDVEDISSSLRHQENQKIT